MKTKTFLSILLFLTLLPAIGLASTVKVAMYGDSTTVGLTLVNGVYVVSPNNEPAVLQAQLRQVFGAGVTVENHGVGGSTCPQWLFGTGNPSIVKSWEDEMAQSTADIVTMNCGINDAFMPGLAASDWTYLFSQFATIAKNHGKAFVLMSPNDINDPHNVTLWTLVHAQQGVVQNLGIPFVDQWNNIAANLPSWQTYLPDNIHPNDAMYLVKANFSLQTLRPLVAVALGLNPAPKSVLIEAYGDSTQYGVTFNPADQSYRQNPGNAPAYLGWSLQVTFGPTVTVSNQGVSGTTAAQLLNGTDGVHPAWATQMKNSKAQIVTINHMINDAYEQQETAQQYGNLLTQLVLTAQYYGKTVVLEEPAPTCADPMKQATQAQFVGVMEWVGNDLGVAVVQQDAFIRTIGDWQSHLSDCIHPDAYI